MKLTRAAWFGALLAICSLPAFAGPMVTYSFTGTLVYLNDPDGAIAAALGATFALGESVTGTATIFDADVMPIAEETPAPSNYYLPANSGSIATTVGDDSFVADQGAAITIIDDNAATTTGDVWAYGERTGTSPALFSQFALADTTRMQLVDESFFIETSLEGWDFAAWSLYDFVDNQVRTIALATIDISDVTISVPEPTTFSLLVAGLAGLAWRRRRAA